MTLYRQAASTELIAGGAGRADWAGTRAATIHLHRRDEIETPSNLGHAGRCHPKRFPAMRKLPPTMAVAEEAVMADAVKPSGSTWIRKRRMYSSPSRVIVFWRLPSR